MKYITEDQSRTKCVTQLPLHHLENFVPHSQCALTTHPPLHLALQWAVQSSTCYMILQTCSALYLAFWFSGMLLSAPPKSLAQYRLLLGKGKARSSPLHCAKAKVFWVNNHRKHFKNLVGHHLKCRTDVFITKELLNNLLLILLRVIVT